MATRYEVWAPRSRRAPIVIHEPPVDPHRLPLPDGRMVSEIAPSKLRAVLAEIVPGVSSGTGVKEAVRAYADYLRKIAEDAGEYAVQQWLAEMRAKTRRMKKGAA